ncbi:glycoside hydrolase family 11 protein [Fibrobacter sp. UWEL]|uniref:glycoside hydrolase family 11 protein n=1 Tax=Fibrobacter sp. UWEL TaxID=1896209 RepID=UPI0009219159|nr:glycoside hydrolase family 11 protein [Fibrobacter sp. UWEL]SHL30215.1 Glycosyl hydrolases family 11 [Fibrobacter sp. UWEL]
MKSILKVGVTAMFVLSASAFAQDFCSTTTHSGTAKEVSTNTVGSFSNGIGYELWNEGGNGGSATFYDDGSFKCNMTGAKDYLCRSGLSFNSDKSHTELGHMKADFKLVKSGLTGIDYSYIGIYGWTREPLVEWYIVDNTGSQYMPGSWVAQGSSAKNHGDFQIDGATYTVYEGDRTSYSIDGDNTYFKQYFSVRKSARDCGTIDITAHFKKWEELGMKMGKMHEAKILGEAGSNSGANAKGEYDFPYAKVYIEGAAAASSSSVAPVAASSSSVAPVVASSSSVAPVAVSSSSAIIDAIHGVRGMAMNNKTMLVFDAQGKFLSSFEAQNGQSLNDAIKAKFNAGVYLVKQGGAVRSIIVK